MKHITCLLTTLIACLAITVPASAQPSVMTRTPDANALAVAVGSDIVVQFSESIAGATISAATFNVDGSHSGQIGGAFSGGGTNTITFNPDDDFQPSEVVTVTLTKGVENMGGIPMDDPVTWQFIAASGSNNGVFSTLIEIGDFVQGADDLVVTDLDRDGNPDVAYIGLASVFWQENTDGAGTFGAKETVNSSLSGFNKGIDSGDVDGDGNPDIIFVSGSKVAWHENRLDQVSADFGPEQILSSSESNATDIKCVDLDEDGDVDVLTTFAGADEIAWFENTDGAGTFGPKQSITTDPWNVWATFAADLDGDNDLDVLSASRWDHEIAWCENRLNEVSNDFGPYTVITNLTSGAVTVSAADLNGDGYMDVLSGSVDDDEVAWYENTDG
ncbi:MAG: hypothetical protein GY869_24825, partial [Planctomycetes bacterium]|nr:hypothetical protein [Planctomycetota bacterium]